jgi:hypothetical protein
VSATQELLADLSRAFMTVSDEYSTDAGIAPVAAANGGLAAVVKLAE